MLKNLRLPIWAGLCTRSRPRMLGLAILCAFSILVPARGQVATPPPSAAQGDAPASSGTPVRLHGKELFLVRAPLGPYSAERRANDISERICALAESFDDSLPEIRAEDRDGFSFILAGDTEIMAISDADASAVGEDRATYTAQLTALIRDAIRIQKLEFSWRALLQGFALAVIATLVLYALYVFSRKGLRWIVWWLYRIKDKRIKSIRFQKTTLLSSRRITQILILAARALWVFLLLFALYVYLPIVFRFFPYTRAISDQIIDYTLTPVRVLWGMFLAEIPNFFFILVICVITYYQIRLARFLFREMEAERISFPGFYPDWAMPTYKILRVLLITFGVIIAYPYIPGSDSDAFKGISIFLGLLFSLGSTGIVANIVSGVILTYTRAFIIGDRVKIGETTGDVIEKTLLVTRLRTIKNVDVSIPNSVLLSSQIVNYSAVSKEKGLILHTTVTIGYDVPWRQVHELLIGAAVATREILEDPKPFILQTSLDDFYVSYELNAYTKNPLRMAGIYSDLHSNIQDRFNEAGVEIMSPHYRAARDGNQVTIPGEYLATDYQPPHFLMDLRRTPQTAATASEKLIPSPVPPETYTPDAHFTERFDS